MVSLQPYDDSMFGDVYDRFLAEDDLALTREEWSRLFRCRSDTGAEHGGYVLLDGATVVGIQGMRFSARVIDGQEKKLCSLHSWMVEPEYRGHSLTMMRPLMRLKDHSIVDFSPTAPVREILRRLRFQELDASLRVLLPIPGRRARHLQFTNESDDVLCSLNENDARLFRDHRAPHIRHLRCSNANESCYLIYSRVTRWRANYCHVHYISDPEFFALHSTAIRREICRREHVRLVAGNDRQLRQFRIPFSFQCRLTNGQMYRSTELQPHQIDSLHSDILLLNLTTMKSLSSVVSELRKRPEPNSASSVQHPRQNQKEPASVHA